MVHKCNTVCHSKISQETLRFTHPQPNSTSVVAEPWSPWRADKPGSDWVFISPGNVRGVALISQHHSHCHAPARHSHTVHVSHALWEFRAHNIITWPTITCIRRGRRKWSVFPVFLVSFCTQRLQSKIWVLEKTRQITVSWILIKINVNSQLMKFIILNDYIIFDKNNIPTI